MKDIGQTEKNPHFFYDKKDFPFLLPLEDNFGTIRRELLELTRNMEEDKWITTFPNYVSSNNKKAWQVFSFNFFLMKFPQNATLCPKTAALIYSIPQVISSNYSYMKPRTHILPHKGYSRMQLRCHLPLLIPDKALCGLRVGDQTHKWEEGELLVFDDSFEHEAWNKTDKPRVVLMFDIPNPLWGYSAEQISQHKIANLEDPFLLGMASKEKWQVAFEKKIFPL